MSKSILEYIPKDQLEIWGVYEVSARNFSEAVWIGDRFQGWRSKWGSQFLDEEFHWDDGPPFGTVKPLRLIKQED